VTGIANTENWKGEVVPVHIVKAYRSSGIVQVILNINTVVLFQDAKRDETARKAYKLLATLHSDCSDLVQMVEETGATVREIRDLEEQVIPTVLGF
jgi:O-succinylbenzoate synthase